MRLGDPIPSLTDVRWLDDIAYMSRAGCPLLVHFWSTGCPLCHEGAHAVNAWRAKYRDALDVVAVYALRPDAASTEVDIDAVRRDSVGLMKIDHPCAIDSERRLEQLFDCPYSPGYFIFDRTGALRHRQIGNAALDAVEAQLDRLTVKASSAFEA